MCLVQAGALQKECSMRTQFWRQQKVKEEELVADLDRALRDCLYTALQEESDPVRLTAGLRDKRWSGKKCEVE